MRSLKVWTLCAVLAVLFAGTACTSTQKGAAIGAVAGGAVGGIATNSVGGAAVGAAVGGVGGALLGHATKK